MMNSLKQKLFHFSGMKYTVYEIYIHADNIRFFI